MLKHRQYVVLIEELKDTLKRDTIYDPEQSMEVKSETLIKKNKNKKTKIEKSKQN